jgi:hypothetical protein
MDNKLYDDFIGGSGQPPHPTFLYLTANLTDREIHNFKKLLYFAFLVQENKKLLYWTFEDDSTNELA